MCLCWAEILPSLLRALGFPTSKPCIYLLYICNMSGSMKDAIVDLQMNKTQVLHSKNFQYSVFNKICAQINACLSTNHRNKLSVITRMCLEFMIVISSGTTYLFKSTVSAKRRHSWTRELKKKKKKGHLSPGQVFQLVSGSSWYAKVVGSIPGQYTYKKQPMKT